MDPNRDPSSSFNPYAPPVADQAVDESVAAEFDLPEPSAGQRFGGYIIDIICFYVLMILFGMGLGILDLAFGLDTVGIFDDEILSRVIAYLLYVIYYVLFEGTTGRTPGKMLVGTRVVTTTGERPKFATIVGRSFSRIVPFEPLSYFGSGGMWHDKWSSTRVVRTR